MLCQRLPNMLVPVVPGVTAGVFGVVVIEALSGHLPVEFAVVFDQFVIDATVERDDWSGFAGGD